MASQSTAWRDQVLPISLCWPQSCQLGLWGAHHTNTLLLLAAHHREERRECRYDDQWHGDGHGSDGPSPRGMHWEVSKGRLLDVSSVTGSKRNIFFFLKISHITGSKTP